MPATAAARRAPARAAAAPARVVRPAPRPVPARAPVRRPAPARKPASPGALGRVSGALTGLADSRLVVGLTRGRLWIGVLTALLVGIVALNVMALSFNAAATRTGQEADALDRQNSALRARIANGLSNDRIQRIAAGLGYVVPEPGLIRYLQPSDGDASIAAKRLASGDLTTTGAVPPPAPPVDTTVPPATDPAATAPATTTTPAPVTDPAATTTTPTATATDSGAIAATP